MMKLALHRWHGAANTHTHTHTTRKVIMQSGTYNFNEISKKKSIIKSLKICVCMCVTFRDYFFRVSVKPTCALDIRFFFEQSRLCVLLRANITANGKKGNENIQKCHWHCVVRMIFNLITTVAKKPVPTKFYVGLSRESTLANQPRLGWKK